MLRFLSTLIISLSIVCYGTTQTKTPIYTGQKAKISGRLLGYSTDEYPELSILFSVVVPGTQIQVKKEVWPDAAGNFSLELDYGFNYQQTWMTLGKLYFGELMVHSDLFVEVDLEPLSEGKDGHFDTPHVTFSGSDGPLTEYLNRYVDFRQQHPDDISGQQGPIMMDREKPSAKKVDALRKIYAQTGAIAAEFSEQNPSPFSEFIEKELQSDMYGTFCVVNWGKEMPDSLLQEILDFEPIAISNSGMSYFRYLGIYLRNTSPQQRFELLKKVLPNEVQLAEEQVRLDQFFEVYATKLKEQAYDTTVYRESNKYFGQQYKEAIYVAQLKRFRTKLNEVPLSEGQKAAIILSLSPEDIWQIPQYSEVMRPALKPEWAQEMGEKEWLLAMETMKATEEKLSKISIAKGDSDLGKPMGVLPSGITYYQATQDSVAHLLSALRGAHPDKAIILDVWATWCGPCILDMKNEKTASNLQKLSGMDVEVVYLCTSSGSDVDTWKKKVAELGTGKQHIFLSDRLSIDIMQYFNLRGYPSHVFLDKDGQLVPNVLHAIRDIDFDKVKDALEE